jgi:hypothetical protein
VIESKRVVKTGGLDRISVEKQAEMAKSHLLQRLPAAKRVLVDIHVDASAAKLNALHLKPKPLFRRRFAAQLDLAAGANDALPWKSLKRSIAQQPRHCPMVKRVACGCGNLAVSRNLAFRNGTNDAAKSVVALLIFAKRVFQNSSLEVLRDGWAEHEENFSRALSAKG